MGAGGKQNNTIGGDYYPLRHPIITPIIPMYDFWIYGKKKKTITTALAFSAFVP